MEDWFEKFKKSEQQEQEERLSSLASEQSQVQNPQSPQSQQPQFQTSPPNQQPQNQYSQNQQSQPSKPEESITQLGASYEIKKVAKSSSPKSNFPTALLVVVVVAPLLFVLIMGVMSNKREQVEKKTDNFLYSTLESDYFSLNIDPNYTVNSVIDKKVPFLERHIVSNTKDGQKTLTIVIKDVKFDYNVRDNLSAKARQGNPRMYSEQPFELKSKEGLYYKKREENFEHFVLLVDRSRSILYEITMESPTTFAADMDLEVEFRDILDGITFIN